MTTPAQRGHFSFAMPLGPNSASNLIGDATPTSAAAVPYLAITPTATLTGVTTSTTAITTVTTDGSLVAGDYIQFGDTAASTTASFIDYTAEIMKVVSWVTTTLTVTRGELGTTATSHTGTTQTIKRLPRAAGGIFLDVDGWWTMPFTGASLAISEMTEMLPPELGSTLFTRGGYKAGAFAAGSAQMEVRLEKYFGKMIMAMGGAAVNTYARVSANAQIPNTITVQATAPTIAATDVTLILTTGAALNVGDIISQVDADTVAPGATDEQCLITAKVVGATDTYQLVRGYNNTALRAWTAGKWIYKYQRNAVTVFQPNTSNEVAAPFLHARRYVPDSGGAGGYTEFGLDGRAVSLSLALPQAGSAKAEFSVVFRRPYSVDGEKEINNVTAVAAASINGISESAASLALSCSSNVAFPALGIKGAADGVFMGAQIQIANATISPQDGMGIGSYYPEDWAILSRGASVRLAYKWKDDALYNTIVYAGDGASYGAWAPQLKYSDVCVQIKAASNAPTGGKPYELAFFIPNAALNMSAPTLLPGRFITTEMVAVASWNGITRGAAWMAFLFNDSVYASP